MKFSSILILLLLLALFYVGWLLFFSPLDAQLSVGGAGYADIASNLYQRVFAPLDREFPYDTERLARLYSRCRHDIHQGGSNAQPAREMIAFLDLLYPVIAKREAYARLLKNVTDVPPGTLGRTREDRYYDRLRKQQHNISAVHRKWLDYVNGTGVYAGHSPRPALLRQLSRLYDSEGIQLKHTEAQR